MRFHGIVSGKLGRLAAVLLAVLLAGPQVAPVSPSVAGETASSSAQDDGMAATPTRAAAASLAIAPAGVAAPPASATQRVLVSFHPLVWRIVADTTSRLPVAAKPAPTILRV